MSNIHLVVSRLRTPKEYIEERQGIEYPKAEYMRSVARKYYGHTKWEILKYDHVYDHRSRLVAITVHGRLTWWEDSKELTGDMVASHRVQYVKDKETQEETDKLSDLGNDTKAANTDCWKKALNFYLNICDDVYRWEDPLISENEHKELMNLITQIEDDKKRKEREKLLNIPYRINRENYKGSKAVLESQLKKENK